MPQGKFFQIKSLMNGLVLDVQGSDTDPGTQVFMWDQKDGDDDDASNQLFWADVTYGTIRTKLNDYCLEINEENTLIINPFDDDNEQQKWQISGDRIMNRADTNMVLDVARKDEDERTRVCAWEWHGDENQLWEFDFASARFFYIRSEMHGKYVAVRDGSSDPDAKIVMWDQEEGADHQLWYEDRLGIIRSKLTDFVLDSSKGNCIRCEPFEPGNPGQMWQLTDNKIINREDRNVLDIKQECEDNGTKLCSWEYKASDNQHFVAEYAD